MEERTQPLEADQNVFLIGRPPMSEYLGFIQSRTVGGESADDKELVDEWRLANDHIQLLEAKEAGIADAPEIMPIPPELASLSSQVLDDPVFERSYGVPTDIGMVELDRLVVMQKHVDLDFVRQLQQGFPDGPSQEYLFRFCLLHQHPQPRITAGRLSSNAYVFTSPSADIRFLDVALLQPNQVTDFVPKGRLSAAVALMVGYGTNYLSAVSVEGRLVLINGSHRAYALRDLGVTHVPCVISHVSRRDELEIAAPGPLEKHADRYLLDPRPSILKDYFDPQLRKLVFVPRKNRQVKVAFRVDVEDVPVSG